MHLGVPSGCHLGLALSRDLGPHPAVHLSMWLRFTTSFALHVSTSDYDQGRRYFLKDLGISGECG